MAAVQRTAIVQGTPYMHDVGVNAGDSLGNTSKLTVSANFEKIVIENFQGGGGNDDAFYLFKDGGLELECRHVSLSVLKIAMGADATAVPAGPVTGETHTVVALNKLIALDHLQDMDEVLVVSKGATTYVEGTHYTRANAGIIPLTVTSGGITAADELTFDYTIHPHQVMQALVNSIVEKGLLFDGVNQRSRSPWRFDFHRVAWSPSDSIELISKEFMSFRLKGEILAWDGITDPAASKFYKALVGDL
ncbi:MAG: hypothetical protein WAV95_15815 [Azonexus sp.]